jgi:diguanylate cyclase (GGDEF)-like protein/PAS domain S-box-containing protein
MAGDNDFFKDILENLYDGVYFVDQQRRITYWNKGAERIAGYRQDEVIGSSCADNLLIHVNDRGELLCKNGCPLAETLRDGQVREAGVFLKHAGGHRIPVLLRVSPIRDESGQIKGAVEVFSDNTAMLEALEKVDELRQEAYQDPLTGLGNRRFIESAIWRALEVREARSMSPGLLFIDIDNFKSINDSYGHAAGDEVLKMVARTIRHNLRSTDSVGRWGGDEFLVLIPEVQGDRLASIAEKLRHLIEHSRLDQKKGGVHVNVTIGATLARSGDTLETIRKRADEMLYRGKHTGRNVVIFE